MSIYGDEYGMPVPDNTSTSWENEYANLIGITPNNDPSAPSPSNSDILSSINYDPSIFSGLTGSLGNAVKSLFTNKDGSLNIAALGALGGGVAGLLGANKSSSTPTGYQGGIPAYTATRNMTTAPVAGRRPGAGGTNYSGNVTYTKKAAEGGLMGAAHGRYLQGTTDGMADKIPAKIGEDQPAALSHGEFVVPADVVSHLGNGNSDAGAEKLYQMMDKIRQARTGTKKQGKEINPDKFMPGGLAKSAYADGGSVSGLGTAANAGVTGTESNLSNWVGPYVTDMLGKGQALSEMPFEQYQGPLTAGASDLQNKVFTGLQNTNFPGNLGQSFSSTGAYQAPTINTGSYGIAPIGTGPAPGATGTPQPDNAGITAAQPQPSATSTPTGIASQYMNPYLQSVLDPQLAELRRQNDITNMQANAKMTGAGAFGGGRQAILNSENNRNLMQEMNKTIGQGYSNAYDKGMQQFNTEQGQAKSLADLMSTQGTAQRGIESEGIAADKAAFEEARANPYKMVQFQQSLLNGLPLAAQQINTATPSTFQQMLTGAGGIASLLSNLGLGTTPNTSPVVKP